MPSSQVSALRGWVGGTLRAERAGHPVQIRASLPGQINSRACNCNSLAHLGLVCAPALWRGLPFCKELALPSLR